MSSKSEKSASELSRVSSRFLKNSRRYEIGHEKSSN